MLKKSYLYAKKTKRNTRQAKTITINHMEIYIIYTHTLQSMSWALDVGLLGGQGYVGPDNSCFGIVYLYVVVLSSSLSACSVIHEILGKLQLKRNVDEV